jgi:hypothetical protein
MISVRNNKPITILNDNSRVVNKLETSLTHYARVAIYDRDMFIVQATVRKFDLRFLSKEPSVER